MPEHEEGVFPCPHCGQKYEVPTVSIEAIQAHLLKTHGEKWERRKVKRWLE